MIWASLTSLKQDKIELLPDSFKIFFPTPLWELTIPNSFVVSLSKNNTNICFKPNSTLEFLDHISKSQRNLVSINWIYRSNIFQTVINCDFDRCDPSDGPPHKIFAKKLSDNGNTRLHYAINLIPVLSSSLNYTPTKDKSLPPKPPPPPLRKVMLSSILLNGFRNSK